MREKKQFPINNKIKTVKIPDSTSGNESVFCQILSLCVIISFQNIPNETSVSGENSVRNQSACSDNILTEILINTKDKSSGHNSDDVVVADNVHNVDIIKILKTIILL